MDAPATCPKCGAPWRPATGAPAAAHDACRQCGLATAKMAAFEAARDADVPAAVREAWHAAAGHWDDPAHHDELFRVVASHGAYAWAASHYRARKDDIAVRQLERLRRAAEATLLASATARPDAAASPYKATRAVLIVLILFVLIGLAYAMIMRARTPARPALSRPVPAIQVR